MELGQRKDFWAGVKILTKLIPTKSLLHYIVMILLGVPKVQNHSSVLDLIVAFLIVYSK